MTWSIRGWERRAIAHLRARRIPVAVSVIVALGVPILVPLNAGTVQQVSQTLIAVLLVLPLMLGSGVVAPEVRSGAALLWLQKPVSPVVYYLRRWIEVTGLTLMLAAALAVACGLLVMAVVSPAAGASLVRAALNPLPPVLAVSLVLFVLSAWAVPMEGVFAILAFIGSGFVQLSEGALARAVEPFTIPIDEIFAVSRILAGERPVFPEHPVLVASCFVGVCLGLAALGLRVTTRSPIPQDAAR